MKKRFFGILAVLFLAGAVLFTRPVLTKADFGDFSGSSDYGGGGWDSGGSDWGGSSDSGGFFYYSSSDDDSDGGGAGWIVWVVLIALVILVLLRSKKGRSVAPGAKGADQSMLRPMSDYTELDPGFNLAELREKLSNLYVQMQERWHEKDISTLKPYMTDAFYVQMDRQLEQKRKNNQTPCTERVAVLDVNFRGFYQSSGMDHLVVRLNTRIVAYILDDATGKVISGSKTAEKFMEYEWDLVRKTGIVTRKEGEKRSVVCPHCGAPLNINATAKCEFCGSVVTIDPEDWAIDSIKGISQRTA